MASQATATIKQNVDKVKEEYEKQQALKLEKERQKAEEAKAREKQYLKEQTQGPSRFNRRVTVRRITPLLNGGQAALPPPPPGIAPPR